MGSANISVGAFGENAAEKYLKSLGYKILRRNYRAYGCEIDIICRDGSATVFVEVKTRKIYEGFPPPCAAVNKKKIAHIRAAASCYISSGVARSDALPAWRAAIHSLFRIPYRNINANEELRIDIIEIFLQKISSGEHGQPPYRLRLKKKSRSPNIVKINHIKGV